MPWTIEFVDGPLAGRRDHLNADVLPDAIDRVDANMFFRYRIEAAPGLSNAARAWFVEQRAGPPVAEDRGAVEPMDQRLPASRGGKDAPEQPGVEKRNHRPVG